MSWPTLIPTKFKKLKIIETPSAMSEGKTIIRCDMDKLTIWFLGKENLTLIDRGWNGEIMEDSSEVKQENRYEIFNRFLESITSEGIIQAESVEVEGVSFPPPSNWKPKTENLKLCNIDTEQVRAWITSSLSISRKFKKLEMDCWSVDEAVGPFIRDIQVSERFSVLCESEMTDEELEKIEALDISITSNEITVEAAKKRLENFLKFGKRSDELELRILHPQDFNARKDLLSKHWTVTKTKKDYEEYGEFEGKIIRGFENVHGIQDVREFVCEFYGDPMRVYCAVFERKESNLMMYPF